jgi:rare lipoprotein A
LRSQIKKFIFASTISFVFIGCSEGHYNVVDFYGGSNNPNYDYEYDYSKKEFTNSSNIDSYEYKKLKEHTSANVKVKDSKAMHRATMRSYTVMGKTYYPTVSKVGQTFDGIASWYGPNFHGKKTSNGEVYDMYGRTAAHKTLPMNTMVKVYNKENGKTTIVRINDRGPFVANRIIDLSNVAAREIDMVKKGTANVRIEILGFDKNALNRNEKGDKYIKVQKDGKNYVSSLDKFLANTTNNIKEYTSENKFFVSSYSVQIGAFSNKDNANLLVQKSSNSNYKAKVLDKDSSNFYKVLLQGFRSVEEAEDFIKSSNYNGAFVIGD